MLDRDEERRRAYVNLPAYQEPKPLTLTILIRERILSLQQLTLMMLLIGQLLLLIELKSCLILEMARCTWITCVTFLCENFNDDSLSQLDSNLDLPASAGVRRRH